MSTLKALCGVATSMKDSMWGADNPVTFGPLSWMNDAMSFSEMYVIKCLHCYVDQCGSEYWSHTWHSSFAQLNEMQNEN